MGSPRFPGYKKEKLGHYQPRRKKRRKPDPSYLALLSSFCNHLARRNRFKGVFDTLRYQGVFDTLRYQCLFVGRSSIWNCWGCYLHGWYADPREEVVI